MFGIMFIVIGIQFFSIGLLGELLTRYTQNLEHKIKKYNVAKYINFIKKKSLMILNQKNPFMLVYCLWYKKAVQPH